MKPTAGGLDVLLIMFLHGLTIMNGVSRNIFEKTGHRIWTVTRIIRTIRSNPMVQHRVMVSNGQDWSRNGHIRWKIQRKILLRLKNMWLLPNLSIRGRSKMHGTQTVHRVSSILQTGRETLSFMTACTGLLQKQSILLPYFGMSLTNSSMPMTMQCFSVIWMNRY